MSECRKEKIASYLQNIVNLSLAYDEFDYLETKLTKNEIKEIIQHLTDSRKCNT